MVSEVEQQRLGRLKEKHADGLLLWELRNGFEMSPRESDLVLAAAKGILLEGKTLERGKHRVVGVALGESAGKTIEEAEKKEVVVTLDGGIEDIEYEKRHGRIALRAMRVLRVIEEGIDQGVVFSTEDLGRMLGVSVRTVKRDVHQLRKEGCEVQTRGYYEGIGRALSHKARIVELYLQGRTYAEIETRMRHTMQAIKGKYIKHYYAEHPDKTLPLRGYIYDQGSNPTHKALICTLWERGVNEADIARRTNHHLKSVGRYLSHYRRVTQLMKKGMTVDEMAHLIGIGKRVVLEYTRIASHFHPKLGKKQTLKKTKKYQNPTRGHLAL